MTRMLVCETTERFGSIAFFENEKCLRDELLPQTQRSAQSLLPTIDRGLKLLSWQPKDVDVIAVVVGPGSFTGLRISVTAAKCFAYAAQAKLVAVETHSAIAAGIDWEQRTFERLIVAIDAQRGEAVVQHFAPPVTSNMLPTPLDAPTRMRLEDLRKTLAPTDAIIGSIFPRYADLFSDFCDASDTSHPKKTPKILDENATVSLARAAGRVAIDLFLAEKTVSPFELLPIYSRLAAACEK